MFERTEKRRTLIVWVCSVLFCCVLMGVIAEVLMPEASGKKVQKSGSLTVDCSNANSGYIMVKAAKSKKRLKVRVKHKNGTLNYDLDTGGNFEVYPLQFGNGSYTVTLYKNVSGNKYSEDGSVTVKAEMEDERNAFLYPNQYVNYTESSPAVQKATELCAGLGSGRDKFEAIHTYMKANFAYDYIKQVTVSGMVLPDIGGTFDKKLGICQDLAAVAICMLRSQGVPAKLMIGMLGSNTYHAWVSVMLDDGEVLYDPTSELNGNSKKQEYTIERWY